MLISNENSVKIPQAVEVVDYQTGEFDRGGEKGLMYWANLSVVDVEELELLKSVGLEEWNCMKTVQILMLWELI